MQPVISAFKQLKYKLQSLWIVQSWHKTYFLNETDSTQWADSTSIGYLKSSKGNPLEKKKGKKIFLQLILRGSL